MALVACEETISPTLENADPVYVVDAWITNRSEPQEIRLTRSQPYLENILPPGVNGAVITVEDSDGRVYTFAESDEAGVYVWTPVGNEVFGEVGLNYVLTIIVNGETITATTGMDPVPVLDSITFIKQGANQFIGEIFLAAFWSTDLPEFGNAYWIKTYKNGELLNKPSDISLAYDAAFARGSVFSGIAFISPIRTSINPFDEDDGGTLKSPYVVGDSVYVEINSLSEAAFDYLNEVVLQTDRPGGFAELFSTPIANVSSNIVNITPGGTKAVGFFNVAAVAGLGRKFESLDDLSEEE
ncbi:MAG: DUF4249 domain-containing protein [Bacteroidota bacterium]|nr:DUF4249 domain-containing protein [Bacteroidota bacterium]